MNITLIGPGIMSIPPKGWGGVESLMWDYKNELEKKNHSVTIINTKDLTEVISIANSTPADFIHLHYDVYSHVMPHINCKNKAVTSHFPYLEHPDKRMGYEWIFSDFNKCDSSIIALSGSIRDAFIEQGAQPNNVYVVPCGINAELFSFTPTPWFPNRSMYLAKIEPRKRQFMLQHEDFNIDFAGNIADSRFNHKSKNYLGEWEKATVYKELTQYANLILLSDGEGHARVCIEGLAAGLGLVVSEQATANLDLDKPFISVIPNSKSEDLKFIKATIEKNREISSGLREEIRKYCIEKFGWDSIISKYESIIEKIKK